MNWAIANRCEVISMSLGAQSPVQAAYTAASQAALNNGLLIVAAAGNAASSTGSPANSPTIMSVASLDNNLAPSSFSNFGKIEIAGPRARRVFIGSAAHALRLQERHQHGHAARGWLRGLVGTDQPRLARHGVVEQVARHGQALAV